MGDKFKFWIAVIFSLSYVLIKINLPKKSKFELLKKLAPRKTDMTTFETLNLAKNEFREMQ